MSGKSLGGKIAIEQLNRHNLNSNTFPGGGIRQLYTPGLQFFGGIHSPRQIFCWELGEGRGPTLSGKLFLCVGGGGGWGFYILGRFFHRGSEIPCWISKFFRLISPRKWTITAQSSIFINFLLLGPLRIFFGVTNVRSSLNAPMFKKVEVLCFWKTEAAPRLVRTLQRGWGRAVQKQANIFFQSK